ncbi:uncharacterized protein LOC122018510 isoform X1 [Zingiber officinale]|uniref:uncharacterized protein LOC122018510 isoform X1 n=1 Tax=Zingiber officinale TaxID=94328 RepID=UPI001C4C39FE|nr:uncharacterized protein LOC122018510 isoform X1 [Zingiber officinale]
MIDDYYIIAFAFSEGAPRNPSWYLRLCPRPPLVAFSSSIPTSQSSSSLSQRTADAVVDEKNYFQWRNPIDRSGKHCHSCSWLATWSPVSDSPSKMPLFLQREKHDQLAMTVPFRCEMAAWLREITWLQFSRLTKSSAQEDTTTQSRDFLATRLTRSRQGF